MAITKIPSSNIYGIGDNSTLLSKNQIEKVEITSDNYTRSVSNNVLTKEYNINFFEVVSNTAVEYIGNDPNKTDIVFPATIERYENFLILRTSSIVNLDTDKNIRLKPTSLEGYYGYTALFDRQWFYIGRDKYETEGWVDLPNYDLNNNTFQVNISNAYVEGDVLPTDYIVVGRYIDHDGKESLVYVLGIKITIQGEYYEPKQVVQTFGKADSVNSIKIPQNELNIIGNKIDINNAQQTTANNIIKKYRNGKEVYTIKCSVGEYYDIYDAKAIDPYDTNYPATFKKHEIVEPYVFTSRGEVPLSEKADGTPKRFEIIGIDFSYKGVVWQELTLQEYIE